MDTVYNVSIGMRDSAQNLLLAFRDFLSNETPIFNPTDTIKEDPVLSLCRQTIP